jgi:hypothetical protein
MTDGSPLAAGRCTPSPQNERMPPVMCHQDRAEAALRLHAVGRTWAEVSAELGYRSRDGARLAVARLQARMPAESVDGARRSASEGLRENAARP